jgi:hypothetical protein
MTLRVTFNTVFAALAIAALVGCQTRSTEDHAANSADTASTAASTLDTTASEKTPEMVGSMAVASSARACDAKTVNADGVGPIRIGTNVDSVQKICTVKRDTTQLGGEGMMERRVTISIPPGELDAEIVDGRVWRLDIRSPAFRTVDSLGVGSTLADLLRHQDPKPAAGEGIVVVMLRDHCGMSFVLSGGFKSGVFRKWTAEELGKLDPSTRVERVLVFGCPRKGA